jgi:hypothetical protein
MYKRNISFDDDLTSSIDDLPLGERTSPNKSVSSIVEGKTPVEHVPPTPMATATPIKKKNVPVKKKSGSKRTSNILGVSVIEERRVSELGQRHSSVTRRVLSRFSTTRTRRSGSVRRAIDLTTGRKR